ncbi:hypothetical protein DL96DRAFT_1557015 [Flagelloscypha sp. PMI_526]|nr:hypothetical protein DL96DRAFT_1557015 [Flagelloscypha sp. PMI_526]
MATDLPEYTVEPVALPIIGLAQTSSETYVETGKEVTVSLFGQKSKVKGSGTVPVYGRASPVKGEVQLQGKVDKIESVVFKLEGFVRLDSFDGFPSKEPVFVKNEVLYSKGAAKCSSKLPFEVIFPTEADLEKVIPATYETPSKQISNLFAKVYYRVVVSVTQKKTFGKSTADTTIDINYYPRTSPPLQPIRTYENFVSSDPWDKETRDIQLKSGASSDVKPISCDFYIPSSRTFGMTEFIPFHITLTGTKPAIDEFLPPSYTNGAAVPSDGKTAVKAVKMKVSMLRKISIRPNNPKSEEGASRETMVGDASVVPMGSSEESGGLVKVEYGGQIQASHDTVQTGTFSIKGLTLQDYLVLTVNPSNSNLQQRKIAVPVKLVTDPWVDGNKNIAKGKTSVAGAVLYGFAWGGF